jgi:hypothetical protein
LFVLCAGSALLLAEDESTSIINGALVGVLLSQSASPSVVCLSSLRTINLGFLTEGKLATILITPSSWGSQRAGHSPRITIPPPIMPKVMQSFFSYHFVIYELK